MAMPVREIGDPVIIFRGILKLEAFKDIKQKVELTALQDHQPNKIRGSGTPNSVRSRHTAGSNRAMRLARKAGS